MNKTTIMVVLLVSLLLSGCCTSMAMNEKKYWALPVAVPADAVLLPGELGLLYLFRDMAGVK